MPKYLVKVVIEVSTRVSSRVVTIEAPTIHEAEKRGKLLVFEQLPVDIKKVAQLRSHHLRMRDQDTALSSNQKKRLLRAEHAKESQS